MTTDDLEIRLANAAVAAAAPQSVVEDVMRQIGVAGPDAVAPSRPRHPLLAAGIAALSGIAAIIAFVFLVVGGVHLTLADVQEAFEKQPWVHIHYDAGQIKDHWINLQSGEEFFVRYDGDIGYGNNRTNVDLFYWTDSGVIDQRDLISTAPGETVPPWTPQTAWSAVVSFYETAAATTQPSGSQPPQVIEVKDTLNGISVIRFDDYSTDMLGNRFIYSQLWADPQTRLPIRLRTHLQQAERDQFGKEWSTGDYDFPATGPTDIYALGVPRGLPIHKDAATAPAEVQPYLDGINRAYDHFLKNYRVISWRATPKGVSPLEQFDLIWRDGENVRQDHHLPTVELQASTTPPLPESNPDALLAWARDHVAIEIGLMDSRHEYTWQSTIMTKGPTPQINVYPHLKFPLLDTHAWPETIQWPSRYDGTDFTLLEAGADTPPGCVGLRWSGEGNSRADYYIDPANDYVCMKEIEWSFSGGKLIQAREMTLSDLHRIKGCVVADTQTIKDVQNESRSRSAEINTIQLTPLNAGDYPPGIFDPAKLMVGAKVVGY